MRYIYFFKCSFRFDHLNELFIHVDILRYNTVLIIKGTFIVCLILVKGFFISSLCGGKKNSIKQKLVISPPRAYAQRKPTAAAAVGSAYNCWLL